MKKILFAIILILPLFMALTSCEKDETVKAGIVPTDTPDPAFFEKKNIPYCQTDRCWLNVSDFNNAKKFQYGSFVDYNQQTNETYRWDEGDWKVISAKKYWYMIAGVHYVSSTTYFFLVPPSAYYQGFDQIKESINLRGYINYQSRTTFGGSTPVLVGYEEYK